MFWMLIATLTAKLLIQRLAIIVLPHQVRRPTDLKEPPLGFSVYSKTVGYTGELDYYTCPRREVGTEKTWEDCKLSPQVHYQQKIPYNNQTSKQTLWKGDHLIFSCHILKFKLNFNNNNTKITGHTRIIQRNKLTDNIPKAAQTSPLRDKDFKTTKNAQTFLYPTKLSLKKLGSYSDSQW